MDNLVFNPVLHVECRSSSSTLQSKENSFSKEPPYKCKFCGRGFQRSSSLQRHERIHTGERPYKCTFCGRGFIESSSLKIHKRTHTGERLYICEFCCRTFTEKRILHVHERTHTGERPYKCKFCGRTFTTKGNLHVHERTHTGDRPYKCEFCGRSFTQNANLQVHERLHTGERPYKCKFCGHSFTRNDSLQKHLRKLHSFAYSSTNRKSGRNTEFLQNSGPVNVTLNVAAQNFNFDKILYEGKNIDSQTVIYHSPQQSNTEDFESENRNYDLKDDLHKCILCSYSFRQENELNLHYITHFDKV